MTFNRKISTPNICPHCGKTTDQDWWCLYCGNFYSDEHYSVYMSHLEDEVKNIRQVISLISSLKTDFSDHWPEDVDRILFKNATLQKDDCDIVINGFSVLDLLDAIKTVLKEQ